VPFAGATYTIINAIDGDKYVGTWGVGSGEAHGFIFDGSTYAVLDYPGASYTLANGIDGSHVVGGFGASITGDNGFDFDGVNFAPVSVPAASFSLARGVSGTSIVGYSGDGLGVETGFLATPVPEPTTAVLVLAGFAACVWFARRARLCPVRSRGR